LHKNLFQIYDAISERGVELMKRIVLIDMHYSPV